jgi:hypothetical protein
MTRESGASFVICYGFSKILSEELSMREEIISCAKGRLTFLMRPPYRLVICFCAKKHILSSVPNKNGAGKPAPL